MDEKFLTVEEIAAQLRVTTRTVNRWCALGMLRARRAGRQWLITPADLEAFLKTNEEVTPKKADTLALAY